MKGADAMRMKSLVSKLLGKKKERKNRSVRGWGAIIAKMKDGWCKKRKNG